MSWSVRSRSPNQSLMLLRVTRLASFEILGCSPEMSSRGRVEKAGDIYGSLSMSPGRFITYSMSRVIFQISRIRRDRIAPSLTVGFPPQWSTASRRLRRVSYHQIECSRCDFAEATVSVQRDGDADRGIVTSETKTSVQQPVVNLIHMQWSIGFAENHRRSLGNRSIIEPVAGWLGVAAHDRNIMTLLRQGMFGQLGMGQTPLQLNFQFANRSSSHLG